MVKEYTAAEKKKYSRRKVADKAEELFRWPSKKEVNPSLRAHVANAYRREWEHYTEPNNKIISYEGEDPTGEKFKAAIVKNLDPVAVKFEEAGDYLAARNSRIAQAKALTTNKNFNYVSAGMLYEAAGELNLAKDAYQAYIDDVHVRNFGLRERVINSIKSLEKRIEVQKKRVERKRNLSIATSVIGLTGGTFFLSKGITGKAISNLSNTTFSGIGGVLFCVGLVGCFFWVKNNKKN